MEITINKGERLVIKLKDTAGEFVVDYSAELSDHLRVLAEFADPEGRVGVIYDEPLEVPSIRWT